MRRTEPGTLGAAVAAIAMLGCATAAMTPGDTLPPPQSVAQGGTQGVSQTPLPASAQGSPPTSDSTEQGLVPAGYGTMHQDDLSFHIQASGVLIRAVPLDEGIIRLLTPDSYRALRDLQQSSRKAIDTGVRRHGGQSASVWLVSFYGVQADAPFTPLDLYVSSSGRDFQPYDVLPLTAGFGEQRLHQRETQSALYLFDGDIQLNQPVTVTYEGVHDDSWEQTLQQIERERALIQARARKAR